MNRRRDLGRAADLLAEGNIPDASLVAEVLLRHTLDLTRAGLYASLKERLSPQQQADFDANLQRALGGEPVAYITGHREFYGLDFLIDRHVLIPRPETELLVEQVIMRARVHPERSRRELPAPVIVDVGTGCGAIAISLAVNLPQACVFATDISEAALEVARRNRERHRVTDRVRLLHGNLLEAVPEPEDIIVANLPYVREEDVPMVTTSGYEPRLALDGGEDGLDVIRRLCGQVGKKLKPGGSLLMEIGIGQGWAVTHLLHGLFPTARITIIPDWNRIERVVIMTLDKPIG